MGNFFRRKSESVYIGYDLKEFNKVRETLDNSGVEYNYKVRNHQNQFLIPGEGTIRGSLGSLGMDLEKAYEYEIKVFPEDVEKSNYIIRQQRNEAKKKT